MRIKFSLPHVFVGSSSAEQDDAALSTLRDSFRVVTQALNPKDRGTPKFTRGDADWCFTCKSNYPRLWITKGGAVWDFGNLVFHPGCSPVDNAQVLSALMNCLTQLNVQYRAECIFSGESVPSLYRSGVYYDRTTAWDSIPALYARGYGDCKSLTAALVAERIRQGQEAKPVFRWVTNPSGDRDYHILVQTPMGFEDPSKVLGMGKNENGPSRRYG